MRTKTYLSIIFGSIFTSIVVTLILIPVAIVFFISWILHLIKSIFLFIINPIKFIRDMKTAKEDVDVTVAIKEGLKKGFLEGLTSSGKETLQ